MRPEALVVDASVVVAAVVDDGDHGAWASSVLMGQNPTARLLYAPELMLVDSTNVLRRLEAAGVLRPAVARLALDDVMALSVEVLPFAPFRARVWELRHNITSYDAWYVAIAESMEAPVATLDRKLAASSGPKCTFETPGPA